MGLWGFEFVELRLQDVDHGSGKKSFRLMLTTLGSWRWIGKGLSAHAHDAVSLAVDWKKGFQRMFMMLPSWRCIGESFSS